MYWAFDHEQSKLAGALPPEPLALPYGHRTERLRGADLQRANIATGRPVEPADCGPVRLISRLGWVLRSPGLVHIEREQPAHRWREFDEESSAYGPVRIRGDRWHGTESGFVASWIAGSEYVKISTGILVMFPKQTLLYQGPLPNGQLVADIPATSSALEVMSGVEYFVPTRSRSIDGQPYGWAAMNVIARLSPQASTVEIKPGDSLGWFFLAAGATSQTLQPLPLGESAAS